MKRNSGLSAVKRQRLETQGYIGYSDVELSNFKFGIRFAYYLCGSLVLTGLLLTDIRVLAAAMIIAFAGSFPPYHPFDYLYNYAIRHLIKKPEIPPRSKQGRFACGIATVWVALIIYLFSLNQYFFGYIAGGVLVAVAALVSMLDICIPSMIYNILFRKTNPASDQINGEVK